MTHVFAVSNGLYDEFVYETTDHKCPECETLLTRPLPSTMLVCSEGHGPFFLV